MIQKLKIIYILLFLNLFHSTCPLINESYLKISLMEIESHVKLLILAAEIYVAEKYTTATYLPPNIGLYLHRLNSCHKNIISILFCIEDAKIVTHSVFYSCNFIKGFIDSIINFERRYSEYNQVILSKRFNEPMKKLKDFYIYNIFLYYKEVNKD